MISSKRRKANTLFRGNHDDNHVDKNTVSIDQCITNRHKCFSTVHDYSLDDNSSNMKYRKLSSLHDENDTRLFTGTLPSTSTRTCTRRQNEGSNFREDESVAELQQYGYSDEKYNDSLSYSMREEYVTNDFKRLDERCNNNSKFLMNFRNSNMSAKYQEDCKNSETETNKNGLDSPDGNINNSNSSSPRKSKSDSAKLIQSCQKILLSQQCQPKGSLKKTKKMPIPISMPATDNAFSVTNIEANGISKQNLDKKNIQCQSTGSKRRQQPNRLTSKSLKVRSSVSKNKCFDRKSTKCTNNKQCKRICSSNKVNAKFVETDDDDVIDEWQSNFVKLLSLPIKIDHGYTANSTDINESNTTIISDSEDNVSSIVAEHTIQHPASLVIKSYYDTNGNGDIQDWIVNQCHLYHNQNRVYNSCMSRQYHTTSSEIADTAVYRYSQEQPLYNDSIQCYENSDTKLTTSDSASSRSTPMESNSTMQTLMTERANEQYEDLQSRFRFNLLRLIGLDLSTLLPQTPSTSSTSTSTSTTNKNKKGNKLEY